MMKRSGALFLAMLYTVTVMGFALNFHYCFNRLSSVKIDNPAKTCTYIGAKPQMKCCKDRHIEVKVKDAHQSTSPSFLSKLFFIALPRLPFENYLMSAQKSLSKEAFDRGPPFQLYSKISIFLKNCIFRI